MDVFKTNIFRKLLNQERDTFWTQYTCDKK